MSVPQVLWHTGAGAVSQACHQEHAAVNMSLLLYFCIHTGAAAMVFPMTGSHLWEQIHRSLIRWSEPGEGKAHGDLLVLLL